MRKQHYILLGSALVLPVVLAGCQPLTADLLQPHPRKGALVSMWEEISPAESRVSILEEEAYVKARRAKYDPRKNLYSQAFLLANGSMIYETRTDVPRWAVLTPEKQIVQRYNKHNELIAGKVSIAEKDIVRKQTDQGDIYYAYLKSTGIKCYVYFRYSEDSRLSADADDGSGKGHYQAITGSFCGDTATADPSILEGEMLQFIANVRFDNGDYTRREILQYTLSDAGQSVGGQFVPGR
jgi:hypothetical protein